MRLTAALGYLHRESTGLAGVRRGRISVFSRSHLKFGALPGAVLALCIAAAPASAQQSAQAATKPFDMLSGSWSGTGNITFGSGDKERIRCRADYAVNGDGDQVRQDLRCASDSYKFEMFNELIYSNGQVTGRWDERMRRTSGTISGRASAGRIEAMAETGGFAALLTMTTRGDQQSVKIESKSPDISDVTITLRRGSR